MYKAGINLDKVFKEVRFAGTHDVAGLAVRNKLVDIVAGSDITYTRMLERGRIFAQNNVII